MCFAPLNSFGRHLPALAGQLEQSVLVDVPAEAFGQVHQLKCLQPFDVFKHVPGVGFQRCLPQPGQPGDAAAGLELQQFVQLGTVRVRERPDQGAVDPAIGEGNGFRAGSINHAQRRQDAPFLPETLQRLTGQQQALVGLLGQLGELVIACGADDLSIEQLAGALLEAVGADAQRKEAWRKSGAAFFHGDRDSAGKGARGNAGRAPASSTGAQSPAGEAGAA